MSIDVSTAVTAFVLLFAFLALHNIVFRFIHPFRALKWFAISYALVLGVWFFISYYLGLVQGFLNCSFVEFVYYVAATFILYTLLIVLYIMGVFSIIESSITLRIFGIIAENEGERGAKISDILARHNKPIIIRRRLERLLDTGDLYKSGKYYVRNNALTYFRIREYVIWFYQFLFPSPIKRK